jgi:hypothetical protein
MGIRWHQGEDIPCPMGKAHPLQCGRAPSDWAASQYAEAPN